MEVLGTHADEPMAAHGGGGGTRSDSVVSALLTAVASAPTCAAMEPAARAALAAGAVGVVPAAAVLARGTWRRLDVPDVEAKAACLAAGHLLDCSGGPEVLLALLRLPGASRDVYDGAIACGGLTHWRRIAAIMASPLHVAVTLQNAPAVASLLAADAAAGGGMAAARGPCGFTPAHMAAYLLDFDLLEACLAGGCDVAARDTSGRTPLAVGLSELSTACLGTGATPPRAAERDATATLYRIATPPSVSGVRRRRRFDAVAADAAVHNPLAGLCTGGRPGIIEAMDDSDAAVLIVLPLPPNDATTTTAGGGGGGGGDDADLYL